MKVIKIFVNNEKSRKLFYKLSESSATEMKMKFGIGKWKKNLGF